jgi:hypothetical protein
MGESRHQFIYGRNTKEREELLKEAASRYPVKLDESSPFGIYICDKGLPEVPKENNGLDKSSLITFNREYCSTLIATSIFDTIMQQQKMSILEQRAEKFIEEFNRLFLNENHSPIKSLHEIKSLLDEAKSIYYSEYVKYIESGKSTYYADNIPVSFFDIDKLVSYIKEMLNNNSYFGIIIDKQHPLSNKFHQAINSLVSYRINANVSMKVACDPDEWDTYYSLNGVRVDDSHDYGRVELDDSLNMHTQKLKDDYYKKHGELQ